MLAAHMTHTRPPIGEGGWGGGGYGYIKHCAAAPATAQFAQAITRPVTIVRTHTHTTVHQSAEIRRVLPITQSWTLHSQQTPTIPTHNVWSGADELSGVLRDHAVWRSVGWTTTDTAEGDCGFRTNTLLAPTQ